MQFVQKTIGGVDSFTLLAIPFFLLAGDIMGKGGISKRMLRFANALVGPLTGGLAVTGVADPGTQQLLYSSSARPASGSSSSSSSSTGYRLLYWGCKGDAVKRLQQALIDAGYKSYVRTADGIYGKWTYDAVRAYQKDVGLSVDGIAGKNTQNKLYGTNY